MLIFVSLHLKETVIKLSIVVHIQKIYSLQKLLNSYLAQAELRAKEPEALRVSIITGSNLWQLMDYH